MPFWKGRFRFTAGRQPGLIDDISSRVQRQQGRGCGLPAKAWIEGTSRRVGLFLSLLGTLAIGSPVSAQSTMPVPLADSIVMAFAMGDESIDHVYTEVCKWTQSSVRMLCNALADLQVGQPFQVLRPVPAQWMPSYRTLLQTPDGITTQSLPLSLAWRSGDPAERMRLVSKTLGALRRDRPTWGMVWFGLGNYALDVLNQPDSAVVFLTQARALGGLSPGIMDFHLARAWYRLGDTVAGHRLLDAALADSARSTQFIIERWLWSILTRTRRAREPRPSLEAVATVRRALLQERLNTSPFDWPILAQPRVYHFDDLGNGPELVVPITLLRQNLERLSATTPDGRPIFPLHVRLTAFPLDGGTPIVRETLRQLASPDIPPTSGPPDAGLLGFTARLPLPPGRFLVVLHLRQPGGGGAIHTLGVQEIGASSPANFRVSDLVATDAASGLLLPAPEGPLSLTPWGEIPEGGTLLVRTAVDGLVPGDTVGVAIALEALTTTTTSWSREVKERVGPASSVVFSEVVADAPRYLVRRWISLVGVPQGMYCVRVTISRGGTAVVRTDPIEVGQWTDDVTRRIRQGFAEPIPRACQGKGAHRPDECSSFTVVAGKLAPAAGAACGVVRQR